MKYCGRMFSGKKLAVFVEEIIVWWSCLNLKYTSGKSS
jgi:hypothetical protein